MFQPLFSDPAQLARSCVGLDVSAFCQELVSGRRRQRVLLGPSGSGKTLFLCLIRQAYAEDAGFRDAFDLVSVPEDAALDTLDSLLPVAEKPILVLLEDLDVLLSQRLDVAGFEQILDQVTVVATASTPLDALSADHRAVFERFDVRYLEPLDGEQAITLICNHAAEDERYDLLGDIPAIAPRVQAVRQFFNGNPRCVLLAYQHLRRKATVSAADLCLLVLDALTPLYRARFQTLSPQQQALVGALILLEPPRTPQRVADELGLSQAHTSAQLKRLTSTGFLVSEVHPSDGRSRLYHVSDHGLFLWLSATRSKTRRDGLIRVAQFLESWYGHPDHQKPSASQTLTQALAQWRRQDDGQLAGLIERAVALKLLKA